MDHRVNRCSRRSRWNVCTRIIQVAEQHNPRILKLSALPQSHANASNDTQPSVPCLASTPNPNLESHALPLDPPLLVPSTVVTA